MPAISENAVGDRMTYLVICAAKEGSYAPERYLSDMGRAATIKDIASGQFSGDVLQVIEINPVERICNDVTAEILEAAGCNDDEPMTAADNQAAAWDHARDLRKHEAA